MTSSSYNLTHLKVLEAESIHIIREVAAEFERPVMLYSIGKDSAVMLRLAQKYVATRRPFYTCFEASILIEEDDRAAIFRAAINQSRADEDISKTYDAAEME